MKRFDYHSAMLELYFKEKGYDYNTRFRLLESNPFDNTFVQWERDTTYNNRTFSVLMKKYRLASLDSKITEVVVHKDNSATKCSNDVFYSVCGANERLKAELHQGRIVVVKGLYNGEEEFLRKLMLYRIPFIVGDCSRGKYFEEEREFFREMSDKYKLEKFEETDLKNNSILLRYK